MTRFALRSANRFFYPGLLLLLLGVKGALLAVDRLPLFLMGDSGVYLRSALGGFSLPSDRSFVYGLYFIRPLLALFDNLTSVVVAQAFADALAALALAYALHSGFRTTRGIAALAAIVYAVEPLSLLYERFLVTEPLGTLAYVLFLTAALRAIRRPSWVLAVVLAATSILAVAMRVVFLPVCGLVLGALLFMVEGPWRQRATFSIMLIALTAALHIGYTQWFHDMVKEPAGYNASAHTFLLAAWAPLVRADDFPDPAEGKALLAQVTFPLEKRFLRANQRFSAGGLIDVMLATYRTGHRTEKMCTKVTRSILKRNPIGVLTLGLETYGDFWDPVTMSNILYVGEGRADVDPALAAMMKARTGEDIRGRQNVTTLARSWHDVARLWFWALLLVPFPALVAGFIPSSRRKAFFLTGLALAGLMMASLLPSTEPSVRYLHPMAWQGVLFLAAAMGSFSSRFSQPSDAS
jgi:hypothetical protein